MSENKKVDIAVIGAGVVGLAIARNLARKGDEVVIFEEAHAIGTQTSARGSHVIHSGIYYAPGSLKARVCVEGKKLLYEYCEEKKIGFKKLGKIIIASSEEEIETLEKLKSRAGKNSVMDLTWLTPKEVKQMEPEVICARGLFSPSTGIIDGPGFMQSLLMDAKKIDMSVELSTTITGGKPTDQGILLTTSRGEILCRRVINSAGLRAPEIARSIAGINLSSIPKAYFAKGHYFKLIGFSPFTHLIYPVPVLGGLGIHATLNLKNEVLFGPDVSWVDDIDYTFESAKEKVFFEAIRKYYPSLADGTLEPDHTGIRPKIAPPGSPDQDFIIQGEDEHDIPGLINLFGIESPGFTASLALAQEVEKKLKARSPIQF